MHTNTGKSSPACRREDPHHAITNFYPFPYTKLVFELIKFLPEGNLTENKLKSPATCQGLLLRRLFHKVNSIFIQKLGYLGLWDIERKRSSLNCTQSKLNTDLILDMSGRQKGSRTSSAKLFLKAKQPESFLF